MKSSKKVIDRQLYQTPMDENLYIFNAPNIQRRLRFTRLAITASIFHYTHKHTYVCTYKSRISRKTWPYIHLRPSKRVTFYCADTVRMRRQNMYGKGGSVCGGGGGERGGGSWKNSPIFTENIPSTFSRKCLA